MEICMGKSITSIYIFFLFFSFCFSQSTEEIAEKTRSATVTVFRNTSIGTGFSIQTNKGPFIITNYQLLIHLDQFMFLMLIQKKNIRQN